MSVLAEISGSIAPAAERVGPSVVGLGRGWGRGSGVVIGDGLVLTNAHNLRGDDITVTFEDGRVAPGAVAGVDADGDIAVIRVPTGNATPILLSEAEPEIGTPVFALATPGGRGLRATVGFVSSAGRSFRGPRGRRVK